MSGEAFSVVVHTLGECLHEHNAVFKTQTFQNWVVHLRSYLPRHIHVLVPGPVSSPRVFLQP